MHPLDEYSTPLFCCFLFVNSSILQANKKSSRKPNVRKECNKKRTTNTKTEVMANILWFCIPGFAAFFSNFSFLDFNSNVTNRSGLSKTNMNIQFTFSFKSFICFEFYRNSSTLFSFPFQLPVKPIHEMYVYCYEY